MKLYLADLTHTGQIVASNVMPLGIGLLASYIKTHEVKIDIELFEKKYNLKSFGIDSKSNMLLENFFNS